jgi:hypothetical protein
MAVYTVRVSTMRYFYRLADNIRILPIMAAIARQPGLWNEDNTRQTFDQSPHAQVNDILLRFGSTKAGQDIGNDLEAVDRPAMRALPNIKDECLNVMRVVNGSRLGRVIITKLEAGKKIAPHSDVLGEYAKYYTRYHLVLQGLPGSLFVCGDETVCMQTGELWWFDASAEHSVINNSKDDRVHMLIDVRIDP